MEREFHPLDVHLSGEMITNAVKITRCDSACILFYNPALDQLECRGGENCWCLAEDNQPHNAIALQKTSARLQRLFREHSARGYIAEGQEFPKKNGNGSPHPPSQMLIPLLQVQKEPVGLLVFEANQKGRFHEKDLTIAQAVADFCMLALQESQKLADRERMIKKLNQLSKASNVLLSEFENKSLIEKLDYIVARAAEILEGELCSLWLVKDNKISLEASYSQQGKVLIKKRVAHPIKDEPKSGMTGYIAFHKKIFKIHGEELLSHPARNPINPVDFLDSQKVYSEIAFPLLDGENLIGLLIAYNKLGIDGQPVRDSGFSEEFDQPLMKILATKLVISIKNATLLKKLRDYELIVESTPDPVVICARDGRILYMNPGANNLFGDLIGRNVVDHYPSDSISTGIQKAREIRQQILKSKDKRLRNYEVVFNGKNGEAIPLSLSACLLYDEHGKEAGTIGIAKNLREIKALLTAGQSLLEMHDIDKILKRITQVCLRLPNSVRAYIKKYEEKSDFLVFEALNSKNPEEKFPEKSCPKDRGMTGHVFQTQQPMLSNDVSTLPIERYHGIFAGVQSKIVVPITYIDKETGIKRKRGVISVDSNELDAFTPNDAYFLNTLANQAAAALENAHLIASKNSMITKLRAFDKVQAAATGKNLDEDQILESVLDAVVEVLGFQYATISKVDKKAGMIGTIKGRNVPQEFLDRAWHDLESKDIQAWVVRHKKPDYLAGWDERLDKEIFEKFNHQRFVRTIIPIFARGEVLGTLETGYDKANKAEIEPDEIETLQRIVNLAGIGIEQANLVKQLTEDLTLRNKLEIDLEALNHASLEILNARTEKEAIEDIFSSLKSIGYEKGMLSLVNDSSQTIEGKYAQGDNWKAIVRESQCHLNGADILAQAIRSKSPILSKNCEKDPACNQARMRKARIRSQYVIPLVVKEKAIGTLQIDLTDRHDLVHGEEAVLKRRMNVVENFARQVAVAIRNIRALITIDQLESNIAETAHEFRSPLHNIMTQLGGLKDILEQKDSDRDINELVDVIEEEINRAKRQMDNTLLLSERTRDEMEFELKLGQIQEVIAGCAGAYRLRALERGLKISIKDNVKRLPRFEFDHDRLEQAITNLIDNAVKYSHYDQYISISGFDDGTNINLDITNRGLGIPENEFEKIFLGFARGDNKNKGRYIPGTGLGLKICREIIQKHGGDIQVKSVPCTKTQKKTKNYEDYLTTFTITLPKSRREK
ncbi:MAG: GAF domain-containing protein [bacterium]